jgi:hypothetical protein
MHIGSARVSDAGDAGTWASSHARLHALETHCRWTAPSWQHRPTVPGLVLPYCLPPGRHERGNPLTAMPPIAVKVTITG